MESLNNLGHNVTVIIAAHPLNIVHQCDQIFLIDRGKVKSKGIFEQLATSSGQLKTMLKIN
jgi:ABC-type bacteriocin/lantibiotic exporter with double-glycine peptidase domain